jgi:NitT/TauT family transport system substrate-binding protein
MRQCWVGAPAHNLDLWLDGEEGVRRHVSATAGEADVLVIEGMMGLRVLQRELLGIDTFGDFKGKIVGTDRLHGPAMNLLSAILHRQGVDPERNVSWKAYTRPDLESALDAKEVSYVAAADPLGYVLLSDHKAEPYLDTAGGGFSCGADIAPGHHCFLVLAGRLVETRRPIAASLTRSFLDATAAIGRGVGPAAVAEATGPIAADIHDALGMLSSYDWSPSTNVVLEELELTARDFRRAFAEQSD